MRLLFGLVIAVAGLAACGSSTDQVDRASWWVNEVPSGTEFEITVPTGSSSCNWFDRIEVDESDDEVEVRAYVGSTGDNECTADMNVEVVMVTLDTELGDRALIGCDPFGRGEAQPSTLDGGTSFVPIDCSEPGG